MKLTKPVTQSWLDIVWVTIHQLSIIYPNRDFFHYFQDICRYVETNWERLAPGKERTSTWTNTVSSTITTHKRIFKPGSDQGFWGLRQHPKDDTPTELLVALRPQMEAQISVVYIPTTTSGILLTASVPTFITSGLKNGEEASRISLVRRKRKTGWGDKKQKSKRNVSKRFITMNEDSEKLVSFQQLDEAFLQHTTQSRRPSRDETHSVGSEEEEEEGEEESELYEKSIARESETSVKKQEEKQEKSTKPSLPFLLGSQTSSNFISSKYETHGMTFEQYCKLAQTKKESEEDAEVDIEACSEVEAVPSFSEFPIEIEHSQTFLGEESDDFLSRTQEFNNFECIDQSWYQSLFV